MSNWAQSVKDQLRNDSNQPLSILEDLVEDGCNFVDDFLSRFNSHQLGPTTELVKTPSRRHNSTRRTRAAVAAAQKSAAKIKKINDDVFNDNNNTIQENDSYSNVDANSKGKIDDGVNRSVKKSPLVLNNNHSPSRLPIPNSKINNSKSARFPNNNDHDHDQISHSTPVNTFHKTLLDIREAEEQPNQKANGVGSKDDNENEEDVVENKEENENNESDQDEPIEELASVKSNEESSEKTKSNLLPTSQNDEQHKQKTSTDFTAPVRDKEHDKRPEEKNSPPRKSLAFASLPRRSPLKKSLPRRETNSRASWLSASVKGGNDSERSSIKRKSEKLENDESVNQSRKAKRSSNAINDELKKTKTVAVSDSNEPKTPADALALKTAEIRKRLTQVAGTQRKVNLFDLPPKEAPITLASEQPTSDAEQQDDDKADDDDNYDQDQESNQVPIEESTTPPTSPPKAFSQPSSNTQRQSSSTRSESIKTQAQSITDQYNSLHPRESRFSAHIPGAYPPSDVENIDKQDEKLQLSSQNSQNRYHETDDDAAEVERSVLEVTDIEKQDEPMDLSEFTLQKKANDEKEKEKEKERLHKQKIEKERIERERIERERLEQEKLEQESLERERLEQEKLEQESLERERLEQEKLEQESLERERLEHERIEKETIEKERVEQESQSLQPRKSNPSIKRKLNENVNSEDGGNIADDDDERYSRPVKQQVKQPIQKQSIVKPLQTNNKFRPRAGSTDSDKKNQFSTIFSSNVTQMAKSLNKKPPVVAVSNNSASVSHNRVPSHSIQAQAQAAERVSAEKEAREKAAERKAAQRRDLEQKRIQAAKEAQERQEAERKAQRDELAKRRREREEAAAAKKQQQQQQHQSRVVKVNKAPSDDENGTKSKFKTSLSQSYSQRPTTGAPVRPMQTTRISNSTAPVQRGLRPSASSGTLGYKAVTNAHRASQQVQPTVPKPVPLVDSKSGNTDSIELPDIASEYSDSEDEDRPSNQNLPRWAESPNLRAQLQMQSTINPDEVFGMMRPLSMDDIFGIGATNPNRHKFRARTSSANWSGTDKLTPAEELAYAERMGFHGTNTAKKRHQGE